MENTTPYNWSDHFTGEKKFFSQVNDLINNDIKEKEGELNDIGNKEEENNH